MDKILATFWKYGGALFTDPKGPNGAPAASFTRVLGAATFGICAYAWARGHTAPDQAFYALLFFAGVKGARDLMKPKSP